MKGHGTYMLSFPLWSIPVILAVAVYIKVRSKLSDMWRDR